MDRSYKYTAYRTGYPPFTSADIIKEFEFELGFMELPFIRIQIGVIMAEEQEEFK